MKKILLIFIFSGSVNAAPFLVSDPSTDSSVDTCAYQDGTVVTKTPTVNGACHADLSAVSQGPHSITVWFESSIWGTASASVPFSYAKPAGNGTGPGHVGISKN